MLEITMAHHTDGAWFLFEPAEPPFPCTEAAAKVWYQMEREMWAFCISECAEKRRVANTGLHLLPRNQVSTNPLRPCKSGSQNAPTLLFRHSCRRTTGTGSAV